MISLNGVGTKSCKPLYLLPLLFVISFSACSLLEDDDFYYESPYQGQTRPGCISEKMRDEGYTYEYAQSVCEGQYYMYGDNRPQYEIDMEQNRRDLEEWNREWEQESDRIDKYLDCLRYSSVEACDTLYG